MYDKAVLECFLKNQNKLYDEKVAESEAEAAEFLEDCMAYVAKDYKDLKEYLDENSDIAGLSKEDILSLEEVFTISDGRYLVVEC